MSWNPVWNITLLQFILDNLYLNTWCFYFRPFTYREQKRGEKFDNIDKLDDDDHDGDDE